MEKIKPGSSFVDVVIVGSGPSALILSYILHGHIPSYDPTKPHPDPILHDKLKAEPGLLHLDVDNLTDHFEASRFSYSTQALPVNSLLDALVRPNADTDDTENTCLKWAYRPEKAIKHAILGDCPQPGGQWNDCPRATTWDIQTLSYAGMLSLPGYSLQDYHRKHCGSTLQPFTRPSRREVADYLKSYPTAVGISDSIWSPQPVENITRTPEGFYVESHNLRCRSIVLASGIFTEPKPARPLLQPLLSLPIPLPGEAPNKHPLLVIGSGFSAADVIISAHPAQKIIHIFKWNPETRPSPLKGCHQHAYPEYAGVYRLMKRSATATNRQAWLRPATMTPFLTSRDWKNTYEGLPNTLVTDVEIDAGSAMVTLQCQDGTILRRRICGLAYNVGRRGSLKYLSRDLRSEILSSNSTEVDDNGAILGSTLRNAVLTDLEVARGVYAIGSLAGDSLVRFAYGGCVYVAGRLAEASIKALEGEKAGVPNASPRKQPNAKPTGLMNGLDGHNDTLQKRRVGSEHYEPAPDTTSSAASGPSSSSSGLKDWLNPLFSWWH